jgi:hypothetical protein
VLVDDLPVRRVGELLVDLGEGFALEGRDSATAGNTGFVFEGHGIQLLAISF